MRRTRNPTCVSIPTEEPCGVDLEAAREKLGDGGVALILDIPSLLREAPRLSAYA